MYRMTHRLLSPATAGLIVLVGWLLLSPRQSSAGESTAPSPRDLVRQLGDDSYDVRERATALLVRRGPAAKAALIGGLESSDAEVRLRCRRALVEVLKLDYRTRLDAFESDPRPAAERDFPAWRRFRELTSDDPPSRELFVSMHRAEPDLMQAVEQGAQQAATLLDGRCRQLRRTRNGVSGRTRDELAIGSIAAMVFLAADPETTCSDLVDDTLMSLVYQPAFYRAATRGKLMVPLHGLLSRWVGRSAQSTINARKLTIAINFDLRQGLAPALAALSRDSDSTDLRYQALRVVGKYGDRRHVPLVETLLDDDSPSRPVRVRNRRVETQIRDVALAVLLHLTKQDHGQYGFRDLRTGGQPAFGSSTIGFQSADVRQQALAKWNSWAKRSSG